ncbi:unnamed protein product [Euphydryas editha]|uniref:Metalloendopeptidase n=1 Tax=Euphydryas editha TaxID=104508 RepID=A0AAU9TQR2_EUPED|nr:unnamed protein product [Euphydryas editha]
MILKFLVILVLTVFSNAAPVTVKYGFEDQELLTDYDATRSSTDAELGEHFEGDMLLSPTEWEALYQDSSSRNGLRDIDKRWPNRTVVYHIVEKDFDKKQIKMIKEGMADIANKSCIRFRPNKTDEHVVIIMGSESGCYSNVGLSGGKTQVLNFAKGCFVHGAIVHEMLHTIGFHHMQNTYNRDDYVKIVWENIEKGMEGNFEKYSNNTVTDFGVPYDYESVMHYQETVFSKNGNKTIIPLQEGVKIGNRNGLSEGDVKKLNRMYCVDKEPISYVEK